jgi:hypothetical protein
LITDAENEAAAKAEREEAQKRKEEKARLIELMPKRRSTRIIEAEVEKVVDGGGEEREGEGGRRGKGEEEGGDGVVEEGMFRSKYF